MKPYYKRTNSVFNEVSNQFSTRIDFSHEIASIKLEIQNHRAEFRKSGVWREFKPEDVEQLVRVATSIDNLLESLAKISSAKSDINNSKQVSKSLIAAQEA